MNYIKKHIVVRFCLVVAFAIIAGAAGVCASAQVPTKVEQKTQAKKLESPKMALLNTIFEMYPRVMLEMYKTYDRGEKLSDLVDKDRLAKTKSPTITLSLESQEKEKAVIKNSLKAVLIPIRDFFTLVKDKGNLIKPVLEEALKTKSSILGKFFESKNDELFFDTEVTTKDKLQQICKEFITFFNCLEVSLSPVALAKFQQEKTKFLVARDKAEQEKQKRKDTKETKDIVV